jgi:hypothetical protein
MRFIERDRNVVRPHGHGPRSDRGLLPAVDHGYLTLGPIVDISAGTEDIQCRGLQRFALDPDVGDLPAVVSTTVRFEND